MQLSVYILQKGVNTMSNTIWGTPEKLHALLCELVSWQSRTKTEGECLFAEKLKDKLMELVYFKANPSNVNLHDAKLGRHVVTGLYKHPGATDTIVLISHFDTVNTEEYGHLEPLAIQPEELTKALAESKDELPNEARLDLESGNYLFGRGTMDMKMGLALHMHLIEKASNEKWPINLLLVTVPDEEVNSDGMRAAVPELVRFQKEYDLTYKLFLNSEPSFSQKPGDPNYYIYSGTIGKIMPSALFYGKETHVGEPTSGMTANFMASFLTQKVEWNPLFRETDLGESTPLPVTLQQKDLKMEYSTQTPYRAEALYNVFLMKRGAAEIMDIFEKVAREAADDCNTAYWGMCEEEDIPLAYEVKVLRYEELLDHAEKKLGAESIRQIKDNVIGNKNWDDREKSIRIADSLMIECQELAPAIILLYAPPFYPAVNASADPLVQDAVGLVKKVASERFGLDVKQIHYFNGICDLSYVAYQDDTEGWTAYERNTPVWGDTYSIPFPEIKKLQAPVLNIGPFGKDAHKRTERLHTQSAFVQLPVMLEELIKSLF